MLNEFLAHREQYCWCNHDPASHFQTEKLGLKKLDCRTCLDSAARQPQDRSPTQSGNA